MFLLTNKLAHHSTNEKQHEKNLPQYINHNEIIYLHWCFIYQDNILSINQVLLSTPAIGLGGHSNEATYTDK